MKLLASFSLFIFCFSAYAITDSINYYMQRNDLKKAKKLTDKAIISKKYDPYVWFQRGEVYTALSKENRNEEAAFQSYVLEACKCFQKAVSINQKSKTNTTYIGRVNKCHDDISKLAQQQYKNKNYEESYQLFEKVLDISALQNKINKRIEFDTTTLFNQALAFEKVGNMIEAKKNYLQLLSLKNKNPLVYVNLAYIYKSENQAVNAIKTLEQGLKLFPFNKYLITDWVNISIIAGKQREIVNQLRQKVMLNKNNADLNFVLASLYDNMNLTLDAEAFYKKTIDIDTGFIQASYNLAVMYYNIGIEKNKQLNSLDRNSESFKAIIAERNILFKKAETYFKKSKRLNPKEIELIIKNIRNSVS